MKMTNDLAYFCGLWIAEGSFEEKIGRVSITCGDDDVGHVLESGAVLGVVFKKSRDDQWRANSYALFEAMRYLKMPLVRAPEKWLPEWVWSGKREWACEVLAGLLDGDGYVRAEGNKVGFTSASERLARDIQLLLTNIGAASRLTAVESKPTERVKVCSVQYRVEVVGRDVSVLRENVKPRIQRKAALLDAISPDLKTRRGIPNMLAHLTSIKSVFEGVKMPELAKAIQTARNDSDVTYATLAKVLEECRFAEVTEGWQAIRKLASEGYLWDEVVAVSDGECETFDFAIPDTHSFWSNGFISHNTPKAYNFLYKLYMNGQKKRPGNPWASWQFPTITSPFIPEDEIEAARADMDDKSFAQEFLASFETMSGRVYYSFDRDIHVRSCPFNPALPIWVGQDFNIDPMSSIILQPQPNGQVWAVGEISLKGSNTAEVVDEIERRYWRHMDNITVFPDPAGGYKQHARGETDLDIFREKGLKRIRHRKKHPPVADRINSVNRMFRSASGLVRLYIDPTCEKLIESVEQTIYVPGGREVDKTASIEHMSDAIGYPLELLFPMRKIEILGVSL